MAVRCVFFVPGAVESCQVLRLAHASPVLHSTKRELETRFCTSGTFIACPIFARIEQGLARADERRRQLSRAPTRPAQDVSIVS